MPARTTSSSSASAGDGPTALTVDRSIRLRGCGLNFALKIAEAKTERHYEALVMEAEHLEAFQKDRAARVVKLMDWETEWYAQESGRPDYLGLGNFFAFIWVSPVCQEGVTVARSS